MRRGAVVVPLLVLALARVAAAQERRVVLRTPGPERPAQLIREVLAAPHDVQVADPAPITLARGAVAPRTLVVLGGDVRVSGTVRGDLLVIGGDVFLRPGGVVEGSVIAVGGCVYDSMLATVGGERECFRDAGYALQQTAELLTLDYRPLPRVATRPVTLPVLYGARIPEYDRVDGVAVPWGVHVELDTGRVIGEALIVYRSALGAFDPALQARVRLGRAAWTEARAERATLSNDRWIRPDLLNSLAALVLGRDTRNYYRAERVEARLGREWQSATTGVRATLGARSERARAVRTRSVWSVLDRTDVIEGMRRPNPPVTGGRMHSGLAGAILDWREQDVRLSTSAEAEVPFSAPGGRRFVQITLGLDVRFPTFGSQRFNLESHAVITPGDSAPSQRYAYLGGSGTLPTVDLLTLGGDWLFFVESRYDVPIDRLRLPIVGPPIVSLRHMVGSAGVQRMPDFVQNAGVRLTVLPARFDAVIDPATREWSIGLGLVIGR